jgi:hypothetical protein
MGFRRKVAAHQTSADQCPLWVISVILKRGTDVGFTPNSDRESDQPDGRLVPIADVSRCSKAARLARDNLSVTMPRSIPTD